MASLLRQKLDLFLGLAIVRESPAVSDQQEELWVQGPDAWSTYNGVQEYILPVPEPLVLKPRRAGRHNPWPHNWGDSQFFRNSRPQMGFVHPVKLFQGLEQ
ncbi:uncharacterized protein Z518_04197 [Rhinocladiella mackenziei CBS 650.93]|uniref:Uncharacterized protein n=1 Tax=Rhinocladiella mackenziei CBS 650.93 TaxID=1442369 RepID=A0A0D2FVM4_9EURO|nr:uncharacterized protein Z518_04197 [Rhinocladiella mackenziei CBS 650.93]KIX06222.1 hypothetical protein Z518_04197 [Rhinocladiella mackenziei CBS 650.93]